jgi:hypothetical protein
MATITMATITMITINDVALDEYGPDDYARYEEFCEDYLKEGLEEFGPTTAIPTFQEWLKDRR